MNLSQASRLTWLSAVGTILLPGGLVLAQGAETLPSSDRAEGEGTTDSSEEIVIERDHASDEQVRELRRTVTELEGRLANLEAERVVSAQTEKPEKKLEEQSKPPAGLSDQAGHVPARSTFREDHQAAPRPGNAPQDPQLDGFFALGNTGVWLKLGGYAKLDLIVDSAQMGNPNKFATSSIYTTSDVAYGEPAGFNMHAKQSRLSFEVRAPTKLGALRVVYENDFFGDGLGPSMTYNLRHLYGQIANFTVGQTWTLYLDADSIPDTLDFAGPGVQAIRRNPQVRYTIPFSDAAHLGFALEQPGNDVTGLPTDAQARSVAPDVTMAFRLENKERGHLHVGAAARVLSYEDANQELFATVGYSANISGTLNSFGKDHFVLNGTFGQGTGHYAQDLGTGNAAVVTADGSLRPLTTWGGFVGYRHFWVDGWTSQATYGYLELEERGELSAGSYRRTHYAQANLIWSPTPRFHIGIEYLYGHKTSHDGSGGDNHRGQLALKFNLF